MEDMVVPVFHHGGNIVRDNKGVMLYIDGKIERFSKMDIDLICFFDLQTLFKGLGYSDYKTMYWFDPATSDFESGLHPINGDKEINELRENKQKNRKTDEFHLYFDHPIMDTPLDDSDFELDTTEGDDDSSDDGYESTEDKPYRPPPLGMEDDSEEDCVVVRKKTKKKIESKLVSKKKVRKRSTITNPIAPRQTQRSYVLRSAGRSSSGPNNVGGAKTNITNRAGKSKSAENRTDQPNSEGPNTVGPRPVNARPKPIQQQILISPIPEDKNILGPKEVHQILLGLFLVTHIIRPPHIMNPPIPSSTPPPIQLYQTLQGISHETMSAASEGTASRMFQFIPNPGFKAPRKK